LINLKPSITVGEPYIIFMVDANFLTNRLGFIHKLCSRHETTHKSEKPMKMMMALALLAGTGIAQAEDAKFSDLEKQAWLEQCTTVYSGDDASCACLLDKQVSKLGDKKVKANLLSMVSMLPDATEDQITKSDAEAVEVAGGDEKLSAAKDEFQANLDENLGECIK
jgi:hypothetical protein